MAPIGMHLLPLRVTLGRITRVADGQGGFTETDAVYATDEPFRIAPASGADVLRGQQIQADVTHLGYARPDCLVTTGDTVTSPDGRTFHVAHRLPPSLSHHVKVLLVEQQRGA